MWTTADFECLIVPVCNANCRLSLPQKFAKENAPMEKLFLNKQLQQVIK